MLNTFNSMSANFENGIQDPSEQRRVAIASGHLPKYGIKGIVLCVQREGLFVAAMLFFCQEYGYLP